MNTRFKLRLAFLALALLNIVHPFVHRFEEGSLDGMLDYLDAWFMSMQSWWTA